jgi:hypothetical protein
MRLLLLVFLIPPCLVLAQTEEAEVDAGPPAVRVSGEAGWLPRCPNDGTTGPAQWR